MSSPKNVGLSLPPNGRTKLTSRMLFMTLIGLTSFTYLLGALIIIYYHIYQLKLKNSWNFLFSYLFGLLAMLIRLVVLFISDVNLATILIATQGTCLAFSFYFLFLAIIIQQTEKIPPWISLATFLIGLSAGLVYHPNILMATFDATNQIFVAQINKPIILIFGYLGLFFIAIQALRPIGTKLTKDKNTLKQHSVILASISIALTILWAILQTFSEMTIITIFRYMIHFLMVLSWTWLLIHNPMTFTITKDHVTWAGFIKKQQFRQIFTVSATVDSTTQQFKLKRHMKAIQQLPENIRHADKTGEKHLFISSLQKHLTTIIGEKSVLLLETEKKISHGLLLLCDYFISLVEAKYPTVFSATSETLNLDNELKELFVKLLKEHTSTPME